MTGTPTMTDAGASLAHLQALVLSATAPELSESVRASHARTVAEYAADLRDLVQLAPAAIGGSAAQDWIRIKAPHLSTLNRGATGRDAHERILARKLVDQLRAMNLTSDTTGLLPKPVTGATATGTGLGTALPLIRLYATDRDMIGGGTAPVAPGVAAGNVNGEIVTEGTPLTVGAAITIANVGAGRTRIMAAAYAVLARQVLDWADPTAQAMLDQVLRDVADRAAEIKIGADLIAAAGGTRVAGADATTLGAALDQAEALAGVAMNNHLAGRGPDAEDITDGGVPGLVICNPRDLPRVRRAVGTSWQADVPHPDVAVSIGAPAATAIVTAPGAVLLERSELNWDPQLDPDTMGTLIAVSRPLYLAVRAAAGVQLVTGIPAP